MADNLNKRPSKGILKNSSSFDKQDTHATQRKSLKGTTWDEMNIIATLHPADKDYGHMKIDEPKTPYNYLNPDHVDGLNLTELEKKIKAGGNLPPKALMAQDSDDDDDDDEDEELTAEERAKKREFENRRKKHYNEFYAVKLARKLLEEDEEDDDASPKSPNKASPKNSPKQSPKHKAQDQSTSKRLPN